MLRTSLATVRPLYRIARYSTQLQPTVKSVAPGAPQSPNRATTWSRDQRPKDDAMQGPRFEQTDIAAQPNAMAAIDLIAEEPIRFSSKRVVSCDGGDAALGHPKVYINLDKPGPHACGYCGIRFQMEDHHH
ncbi:zinc-finger domain-domain-containing protein [Syncephalastrum racemosum]|uniref:Zinc-finger domain-domain-containing protein n=1 Tax=Syncephalastrum racemosum TaxID=13706 RepID=A0A1X2H748_SYNRA|nr:zinc-finger domain-domain-containing protein [Syncephalastrum racemosum]